MEPGDRIVLPSSTSRMVTWCRTSLRWLMSRYSIWCWCRTARSSMLSQAGGFEDSDVSSCQACPITVRHKPAHPDFLHGDAASIVAATCEQDLPCGRCLNKTVAGVVR